MARIVALLAALSACAGPPDPGAQLEKSPEIAAAARDAAAPVAGRTGPIVTEAQARALLADEFRRAGLRVLFDVDVSVGDRIVTLDGFDPARQIGFEYIAREEESAHRAIPRARGTSQILWIDATDEASLKRQLDGFVGEHLAADAGPP